MPGRMPDVLHVFLCVSSHDPLYTINILFDSRYTKAQRCAVIYSSPTVNKRYNCNSCLTPKHMFLNTILCYQSHRVKILQRSVYSPTLRLTKYYIKSKKGQWEFGLIASNGEKS